MESQSLIDILKAEGFSHVYTWTDAPGTVYEKHSHKDKVSLYITQGDVRFVFDDGERLIASGERFDVPVGKEHTAVVGDSGCEYVVGEMIEGDS